MHLLRIVIEIMPGVAKLRFMHKTLPGGYNYVFSSLTHRSGSGLERATVVFLPVVFLPLAVATSSRFFLSDLFC